MKKTILAIILCLLLLCLTACGNNMQFASNEEMLQYLEGMWVVDDNNAEKTYYIFQDNQLYIITEDMYAAAVKNILDSALENGGIDVLRLQNFDTLSKKMYLSDFTNASDHLTLLPKKGKVTIYKGQHNEKSINITENAVIVGNNGTKMEKLSTSVDFTSEQFEAIFNNVIAKYEIPASLFLLDSKEYGELIKGTISTFDFWSLTPDSDADTEHYIPFDFSTVDGSYLKITNESVSFLQKYHFSGGITALEPSLQIAYTPQSGSFQATYEEDYTWDLFSLVEYGICVTQNVPGAYTNAEALYYTILSSEQVSTVNDMTLISYTANGITYTLAETSDGAWGRFEIEVTGTAFYLSDIITPAVQEDDLSVLLNSQKSWIGQWTAADGWEYNVYFVFQEDGVCYFALGSETELYGAGKGTYTVNYNNEILVDITFGGEQRTATYVFDPNTFALKVISQTGLVGYMGDIVILQENTDNDVEQVTGWGEMFAEGASDEENELWGD